MSKKTKKNPWSDNESDDQSPDSEMEAEEVTVPRECVERKTKGEAARCATAVITHSWPLFHLYVRVVITPQMFWIWNLKTVKAHLLVLITSYLGKSHTALL